MDEHRTKTDSDAFGTNGTGEEYSPFRGQTAIETDRGRFSGTCETTLNDWIQLVQMGRRDAVVSVRTFDGKEGTLWCREGDIVDAHCEGAAGEAAVFRALGWRGGRVTVAFVPVTRERRIQTATAGLLLEEAYRRDSGMHDLTGMVTPSDGADLREELDFDSDPTEISGPSDLLMQGQLSSQAEWLAHGEDEHAQEPPPALRPSISLPFAVAGGLTVVLVFSVIAWKWVWPPHSDAAMPSPPATVVVQERPPAAAVAASALPGDVLAARPTPAVAASPPAVSLKKAAPPRPISSALAHHRAAPARRPAATSTTALNSPSADGPKASQLSGIEIIKEAPAISSQPQPRIQLIQEAAQPGHPRVQIIQDRKPHIETVE